MSTDTELIYVADPMCSWCYGFAPELERFLADKPIPSRLVMGGLWVGARVQPLTEQLKRYLRHAWGNVGAMSGQPFTYDILEWSEEWVYDTEPACRAVVTMRELDPTAVHRFFNTLQYAFYAENRDITDDFVFASLLEGYRVDVDTFRLTYGSREVQEQTRQDFDQARRLGAIGFPTLFLRRNGQVVPLTKGYKKARDLQRTLEVLAG